MYSCFPGNETTGLFVADLLCLPACAQLAGQSTGQPYNFFDDQWSSLYAWRSIGNSSYHSMQLSLRHAMTSGLQFDFNYTFSKSIDVGSNAERINEFEGFGFGSQIINAWSPNSLRAVSDFDTKHQINSNWVYEFPLGHGRRFGSGMNKFVDAVFGGWGLSGIFHWTSGLPFSIGYGAGWPTNWQLQGNAIQTGPTGKIGVFRDSAGNPNIFQNPAQAGAVAPNCPASGCAFRFPLPGESGQRNNFRGPGYLELDNGLYKTWKLTEGQSVKFSWEAFNVTNTPRFDAAYSASLFAVQFGQFGRYADTLSKPRVMQFALRYDF